VAQGDRASAPAEVRAPQKPHVRATRRTHPALRPRPSLLVPSIRAVPGASSSCASSVRTFSPARAADAARSSRSSTRSQ
jgi:hypothetical protein